MTIKKLKKTLRKKIKWFLHRLVGHHFKTGMHLLRKRVWRRDRCTCQLCHDMVIKLNGRQPGRINPKTGEVHHIRAKVTYQNLVYRADNCVPLCHRCHKFVETLNALMNPYQRLGWIQVGSEVTMC